MIRLNIVIEFEAGRKDDNRPRLTERSWNRLKLIVKNRDKATCRYCGAHALDGEPDHVLPLARGGTDAIDNLVWACTGCNQSKGNKTIAEWGQFLKPPRSDDALVFDDSVFDELDG